MTDTTTTIAALDAVEADPKMRAEREDVWNESMAKGTTHRPPVPCRRCGLPTTFRNEHGQPLCSACSVDLEPAT